MYSESNELVVVMKHFKRMCVLNENSEIEDLYYMFHRMPLLLIQSVARICGQTDAAAMDECNPLKHMTNHLSDCDPRVLATAQTRTHTTHIMQCNV